MPVYTDKKSGRLYVEFQYKGQRVKERLPNGTSKKDADKIEIRLKNDLLMQIHGIVTVKPLTFDDFIIENFGPHVEATYSPERRTRAELLVKALKPFVTGMAMRDIKAADLERFKASRMALITQHGTTRKPATVEREMSIISTMFSFAVDNDIIDYNPCGRVRRIKFNNELSKVLRHEDEEKFFANLPTEWSRDVCRIALETGLRQKDIMQMTRFQVDFENKVVRIVQSKTVLPLLLPLNDRAIEVLQRRVALGNPSLFVSPVTGKAGSVRHSMLRACAKAGIEPPLTIRDLRRTRITRRAEIGIDHLTNARLAGHGSVRMIHRYVKSDSIMREAVELENPKLKVVK